MAALPHTTITYRTARGTKRPATRGFAALSRSGYGFMCTTYRFSKNIYAYSAGLNPGVCALPALAFLVIHSLLLNGADQETT